MIYANVERNGNQVLISALFGTRVFSLFSFNRRIAIDPDRQTVEIDACYLYCIRSKVKLKFSDLWYLDYGYEAAETKEATVDVYTVSLVARNEHKYKLFAATGEETKHFGLGLHQVIGNDDAPRNLLVEISQTLGIPIGKPLPEEIVMNTCRSCGRKISAVSAKCVYCGAACTPTR